jgi:hypothetical protein
VVPSPWKRTGPVATVLVRRALPRIASESIVPLMKRRLPARSNSRWTMNVVSTVSAVEAVSPSARMLALFVTT